MLMPSSQSGFTIFEALIYIALFTIVVGGSILTAYQLFQGSAQMQRMAEQENELNFILRKLNYLIDGADSITNPGPSETDPVNLLIINNDAHQYRITRDANDQITLQDGVGDAFSLTSSRLRVTNLTFERDNTTDPHTLTVALTANSEVIGPFIYYLR